MLIASIVLSPAVAFFFPDFQFVNRIWAIFLGCAVLGVVVSKFTNAPLKEQSVKLGDINFKTSASFNMWSVIIGLSLIALYAAFW